jgi:hypothetical protein
MSMSNRIGRLLLCLLVVSAAAGATATPAAAETTVEYANECSTVDRLVAAYTLGTANTECVLVESTQDSNVTEQAAYNSMVSVRGQYDSYMSLVEGSRSETKVAMQMEAEIAIAEAYQNDESAAQAKAAAADAIDAYAAQRQRNLAVQVNNTLLPSYDNAMSLKSSADASQLISTGGSADSAGGSDKGDKIKSDSLQTTSRTDTQGNTYYIQTFDDNYGKEFFDVGVARGAVFVDPPSGSGYDKLRIDIARAWEQRIWLENAHADVESNVNSLVDETYPAYEAGELNASDVISRNNKVYNLGLNGTENGTFANNLAAYSALGVESPNLTDVGTMTVEHDGISYEGVIYSTTEPPNGTWDVGTTYNASTLNGSQFLVTVESNEVTLDGEFTVTAVTGPDGAELTSAEVTTYKQDVTANTTSAEYRDSINRLQGLIDEYENRTVTAPAPIAEATDGDGLWDQLVNSPMVTSLAAFLGISAGASAFTFILIVAAVVLLLLRNGGG